MNRHELQRSIDALIDGGANIRCADNHRISKLYVIENENATKLFPVSGTVLISSMHPRGDRFRTEIRYEGDNRYGLTLRDTQHELEGEYVFSQIPAEHLTIKTELIKPIPTLYEQLKETA